MVSLYLFQTKYCAVGGRGAAVRVVAPAGLGRGQPPWRHSQPPPGLCTLMAVQQIYFPSKILMDDKEQ